MFVKSTLCRNVDSCNRLITKNNYVIPVLANHDKTYNEENLNYIVKIKNKTILYASDTGWYDNDNTWKEILKHRYDAIILEFSFISSTDNTHMDYEHFMKMIEYLMEYKCIGSHTQIIATHFQLHHRDLEKIALLEKAGVKIAYRGMVCEC